MTWHNTKLSILPYVATAAGLWYFYKLFVAPLLSPLRKIPGRPFKPIFGNMLEALEKEAMENTINWMTEYKSRIVRYYSFYGVGQVLVGDPDLVRHVMVTHSKNYKRTGSPLTRMAPGFILFLDGEEHHAMRKLMNPVFTKNSTNEYIPVFEELAMKLVKLWLAELSSAEGDTVEVPAQDYMSRLTLEAVCRCGFDYNINSLEDPDSSGVQSFKRTLSTLQIKLSNMLPLQGLLPTKSNRQMKADLNLFYSTINDLIAAKRLKMQEGITGEVSIDLLSRLLLAKDEEGKTLSDASLFGQVGGFLFAGFETTSIGLTWALLLLAQHPDVQEKVRQEVSQVLADPHKPFTPQLLDQLTYLTAVIRESMRLYPPVSTIFRRAARDDYLGGYLIPAGTVVGVGIGALHRLPSNWEDPLTFKPERFLAPQEQWNHKFLPFNTGPYMCIGHIFSLTETKITMALLLRHFRLSLPPGYKFRRARQLVLQPKPPLSLILRPVDSL